MNRRAKGGIALMNRRAKGGIALMDHCAQSRSEADEA